MPKPAPELQENYCNDKQSAHRNEQKTTKSAHRNEQFYRESDVISKILRTFVPRIKHKWIWK